MLPFASIVSVESLQYDPEIEGNIITSVYVDSRGSLDDGGEAISVSMSQDATKDEIRDAINAAVVALMVSKGLPDFSVERILFANNLVG